MNSLNPYEPKLTIRDGHAVTTSRHVAESFGKQHDNVLQSIRNAECSEEFRRLNFQAATYRDAQGKPRPEIEMTRDGFCFVAMGFTGARAAQWKEAYIRAFNTLEARMLAAAPKPAPTVPADQLSAAHAELLDVQRKLIASQERLLAVTSKAKRSRPRPQPMTDAEIATIRQLRAQGLSCADIARQTGRSPGTVSMISRDAAQADLFGGAA